MKLQTLQYYILSTSRKVNTPNSGVLVYVYGIEMGMGSLKFTSSQYEQKIGRIYYSK
ncbi:hypothetical protein ABFV50_06210 [Bacillus cereus]